MRLAAFDLDGTLLRGQTVCESIAQGIGHIQRMREFERLESTCIEDVTAAREEMAGWYSAYALGDLREHLNKIRVAPGVDGGFSLLRARGFKIAIVSLTWKFAVEWFADVLGADYSVGTGLSSDGLITHFWPQDKALWLTRLAHGDRCRDERRGRRGRFAWRHTNALVGRTSVLGRTDDSTRT
jgi:phosphoserine phosphatase